MMENHDKIFEQLKQAADNAESKEFPGLESVWSRVEDKLDNKVLSKQNKKWKQWAVAASVVAVVSLGYQVYRNETETNAPAEKIYVVKAKYLPGITQESPVVSAPVDTSSSVLRQDAEAVLQHQSNTQVAVARAEEQTIVANPEPTTVYGTYELRAPLLTSSQASWATLSDKKDMVPGDSIAQDEASEDFIKRTRQKGIMAKGRVFDAKIVTSEEADKEDAKQSTVSPRAGKRKVVYKPLLVVDGRPLRANSDEEYLEKYEEIMRTVPTERDTVFYLRSPLYVINGTEYSEESLFGSNPTSPYAPLNLQEEGMTTRIYTGKDAIKRYGEKGKNGVIVIKTRDGKPAPKRKK